MTNKKKRERLCELAKKVSACHLCETIYSIPGYPDGDHLCHSSFADSSVMNHWNTWMNNNEV